MIDCNIQESPFTLPDNGYTEIDPLTLELIHEVGKMSIHEIENVKSKLAAEWERVSLPRYARTYVNAICDAVIEKKQEKLTV